jgi:O-antigen/teichoic acid export membrane protein
MLLRSIFFRAMFTGITFVSSLVMSKLLVPAEFGVISLLILNSSLLLLLTGFGADSLVMQRLSNKIWTSEQALGYLARMSALQLGIGVLAESIVYLFLGRTLLSGEHSPQFVWIDLLYFSGLVFMEKSVAFLYARYDAMKANLILFIFSIVYLGALLLILLTAKYSWQLVAWLFALNSVAQGAFLVVYLLLRFPFRVDQLRQSTGSVMQASLVIVGANILQLIAYRVDFWMLKYFHGQEQLGVYALSGKFANLVWVIPNVVAQIFLPYYSRISPEQAVRIFRMAMFKNIVVGLIALVVTWLVYRWFISPSYQEGLQAFYWMLPGYIAWASVIYFASYFSWAGKFHFNLWGSALCVCLIIVFDYLLIPAYSIKGAAIANSVCYAAVCLFYMFLLKWKYRTGLGSFFYFRIADIRFLQSVWRSETK